MDSQGAGIGGREWLFRAAIFTRPAKFSSIFLSLEFSASQFLSLWYLTFWHCSFTTSYHHVALSDKFLSLDLFRISLFDRFLSFVSPSLLLRSVALPGVVATIVITPTATRNDERVGYSHIHSHTHTHTHTHTYTFTTTHTSYSDKHWHT